jgi:hypothetical protein
MRLAQVYYCNLGNFFAAWVTFSSFKIAKTTTYKIFLNLVFIYLSKMKAIALLE